MTNKIASTESMERYKRGKIDGYNKALEDVRKKIKRSSWCWTCKVLKYIEKRLNKKQGEEK